ncbi:hypothetical protein Tco_0087318 [Tanacetum coccineum]
MSSSFPERDVLTLADGSPRFSPAVMRSNRKHRSGEGFGEGLVKVLEEGSGFFAQKDSRATILLEGEGCVGLGRHICKENISKFTLCFPLLGLFSNVLLLPVQTLSQRNASAPSVTLLSDSLNLLKALTSITSS